MGAGRFLPSDEMTLFKKAGADACPSAKVK